MATSATTLPCLLQALVLLAEHLGQRLVGMPWRWCLQAKLLIVVGASHLLDTNAKALSMSFRDFSVPVRSALAMLASLVKVLQSLALSLQLQQGTASVLTPRPHLFLEPQTAFPSRSSLRSWQCCPSPKRTRPALTSTGILIWSALSAHPCWTSTSRRQNRPFQSIPGGPKTCSWSPPGRWFRPRRNAHSRCTSHSWRQLHTEHNWSTTHTSCS